MPARPNPNGEEHHQRQQHQQQRQDGSDEQLEHAEEHEVEEGESDDDNIAADEHDLVDGEGHEEGADPDENEYVRNLRLYASLRISFAIWRQFEVQPKCELIEEAFEIEMAERAFSSCTSAPSATSLTAPQEHPHQATNSGSNNVVVIDHNHHNNSASREKVDLLEEEHDTRIPSTEDEDFLTPKRAFSWRHILPHHYSGRSDLCLKGFGGTRCPLTKRFAWEHPELDFVVILPLGPFDVEYCLDRLATARSLKYPNRADYATQEAYNAAVLAIMRPLIVKEDFTFVLLLSAAICRRFMAQYAPRHPDCGVETVALRFLELKKACERMFGEFEAACVAGLPVSNNPISEYLMKYFVEIIQLCGRHIAFILCDATKAPILPDILMNYGPNTPPSPSDVQAMKCFIDGNTINNNNNVGPKEWRQHYIALLKKVLCDEAIRVDKVQGRYAAAASSSCVGGAVGEPKLDLRERTAAESNKYIRRCAALWRAGGERTHSCEVVRTRTVLSGARTPSEGEGETEGIQHSNSAPTVNPEVGSETTTATTAAGVKTTTRTFQGNAVITTRQPVVFKLRSEEEYAYLQHIVSNLPDVMSVPHPLSAFAIKPFYPIVALGNHFTCDLCYAPFIRASYQAVQDDDLEEEEKEDGEEAKGGDEDDEVTEAGEEGGSPGGSRKKEAKPTAAAKRNAVELIKNCFGFDLCLRCAAQYYNEALRAVAQAIQWPDAPLYSTSACTQATEEEKTCCASDPISAATAAGCQQVTLCDFIGGSHVASPVNPNGPSTPASRHMPGLVKLVACASRQIIDINNQLSIQDTAFVRLKQQQQQAQGGNTMGVAMSSSTDSIAIAKVQQHDALTSAAAVTRRGEAIVATLVLKCAVAPMGARPMARKWKEGYLEAIAMRGDHEAEANTTTIRSDIEKTTEHGDADPSAGKEENSDLTKATAAAAKLRGISNAMHAYFTRASRCYAKRCLNEDERRLLLSDNEKDADYLVADDDEEEDAANTCPICMEPLAPRGNANTDALENVDENNTDNDFVFEQSASVKGENIHAPSSSLMQAAAGGAASPAPTTIKSSSAMTRAVVQTNCRHWFHAHCIDRCFAERKNTCCPMCRNPDALDSLTAKRFQKKKGDGDASKRGEGTSTANPSNSNAATEENVVTPEMIAEEARRNLEQNIYELRVPLTQSEIDSGKVRILIGTLVSLDCQYHNPTDIGCLSQLEVRIVHV